MGSGQRTIDEMSFAWVSLFYLDDCRLSGARRGQKENGFDGFRRVQVSVAVGGLKLRPRFASVVWLWAFTCLIAAAQTPPPTYIPQTKFSRGQDVVPSFDGWIRNTDGTFTMVFGYMNRNYEEELVIPAGPDNQLSTRGRRSRPAYVLPAAASRLGISREGARGLGKQGTGLDHQRARSHRKSLWQPAIGRGDPGTVDYDPWRSESWAG